MSDIGRLLYYIGYPLLISPSHVLDLKLQQVRTGGELANLPISLILLFEFAIRVGMLLVVAVVIDQLLGNLMYELFMGDTALLILLVSGTAHTLAYYLLLVRCRRTSRTNCYRVYRLVRNLCFATLPGVAAVVLMLIYLYSKGDTKLLDPPVELVYSGVTVFVALIGFVEFLVSKRQPVGLDRIMEHAERS